MTSPEGMGPVRLLAVTVVAAALLGLVWKAERYASYASASEEFARAGQRIDRAMSAAAWRPVSISPDGRETFAWAAYQKEGCGKPVVVALLNSAELMDLARSIYGPSVTFLGQDATPAARLLRHVEEVVSGFMARQSRAPPLLAIADLPDERLGGMCRPPLDNFDDGI